MSRRPRSDKRYGFFRCPSCNGKWESAFVWCVRGTEKVYYKQDCKACKTACNPYRVEPLKCSKCGQVASTCTCDHDEHHVDMNKPHRSDLCHKCKSGHPCNQSRF